MGELYLTVQLVVRRLERSPNAESAVVRFWDAVGRRRVYTNDPAARLSERTVPDWYRWVTSSVAQWFRFLVRARCALGTRWDRRSAPRLVSDADARRDGIAGASPERGLSVKGESVSGLSMDDLVPLGREELAGWRDACRSGTGPQRIRSLSVPRTRRYRGAAWFGDVWDGDHVFKQRPGRRHRK